MSSDTSSMSIAQLREAGSSEVKAGNHSAALSIYTRAINAIASDPSLSNNNERAILHSNRAACYLAMTPAQPNQAIIECDASIALDNSYVKSHFRKAQAHEALSLVSGISDIDADNHLNASLLSLHTTLKLERNNPAVVRMAERVRLAQQKRREAAVTPLAAIGRLTAAATTSTTATDESEEIKRVMAMFVASDTNKKLVNDARFPSLLCDIILRPQPTTGVNSVEFASWSKLRVVAIRALQTVVGTTPKPVLDVTRLLAAMDQLLGSLRTIADGHRGEAKLSSSADNADSEEELFGRAMITLLSRLMTHDSFMGHRQAILDQILRFVYLPDAYVASESKSNNKSITPPAAYIARVTASLECISQICRDHNCRKLVRKSSLPHLLYSNLPLANSVRKALLSTLANVTGAMSPAAQKEMKDKIDTVNARRENDKKKAEKAAKKAGVEVPVMAPEPPTLEETIVAEDDAFKEVVTQFLLVPLLSDSSHSVGMALRAISLLLQSNPPVAFHLLHHAGPQTAEKISGKAAPSAASTTSNGEGKSELKEVDAEAEAKITPLMAISGMVATFDGEVKTLAAEVLALASSDTLVRTTLANSPFNDSFFPLLNSHDPLVRCHAGLALSKLSAIGNVEYSEEQLNHIGVAMLDMLVAWQRSDEARVKKAAANTAPRRPDFDAKAAERDLDATLATNAGVADDYSHTDRELLRHCIESIAYLSLNIQSKKLITTHLKGEALKALLVQASSTDASIRFGVIEAVRNLTTSQDDIEREYDKEVEQLRELAAKGLPGAASPEKKAEIKKRAGTAKAIKLVTNMLVKNGGVRALSSTVRAYTSADLQAKAIQDEATSAGATTPASTDGQSTKVKAEAAAAAMLASAGITPPTDSSSSNSSSSSSDTSTPPSKRPPPPPKRVAEPKKERKDIGNRGMSDEVAQSVSSSLLSMASDKDSRGLMVQQGVLPMLVVLSEHPNDKCQDNAALAIARICITTNPNLFPQEGIVFSLIMPMLRLCKKTGHELYQFEISLALANLASMNEEVRQRMVHDGCWSDMISLLTSDNHQVQRAALEVMTNLVMCELIQDRLRGDSGDQDLQYFIIFAQTDDIATQCAATGALAMLSQDGELAVKIARCSLQTAHQPTSDDTVEEKQAKARAAADEVRAAEAKQAKRAALTAANAEKDKDKEKKSDNSNSNSNSNSTSSGMTIEVIDDEEEAKELAAAKAKAKAAKAAAAKAVEDAKTAAANGTNGSNGSGGAKPLQKTGLALLESLQRDTSLDGNVMKRVQFALTNVRAALEYEANQQTAAASAIPSNQ